MGPMKALPEHLSQLIRLHLRQACRIALEPPSVVTATRGNFGVIVMVLVALPGPPDKTPRGVG